MIAEILVIIGAYLLGSIPFAYIFGKVFFKADIRKKGSGNVGGANAIRTMGTKIGVLAGLLDILKGTFAVLLAQYYASNFSIAEGFFADPNRIVAFAAFFVVLGHCYPVFLNFSGGKGGATTAGIILALDPLSAGIMIIIWIFVISTTRFTSLGNLLTILILPVLMNIRGKVISLKLSSTEVAGPYQVLAYILIILIYFQHRTNISRLLNGSERKFGEKELIS